MRCGIDLGSRQVKVVVLEGETLKTKLAIDTIEFYRRYGQRGEHGFIVDFAAIGLPEGMSVVATGYGRNTLDIAGAVVVPELRAHMTGAIWQTGLQDFTLLDLGGQDSKVIKVRGGKMTDFATNDKCAASTGRYLENMATVLGMTVAELAGYDEDPVSLDGTCAIFGESELIGRIVEGYTAPVLAAGVNYTVFKRIKPDLLALGSDIVVFTGGVALGSAIRTFIERELAVEVVVPAYPQWNGAIGCALQAKE